MRNDLLRTCCLVLAMLPTGCSSGSGGEVDASADGGPDGDARSDSDTDGDADGDSTVDEFVPEPLPELRTETDRDDAPIYVFLFTHTEDHINHELSEERYLRIAPMLEDLASESPDAYVVWTVQFQGADALSVAERNPETGVVDLLQRLARTGLVHFGYHGQHDPTYANRPQNELDESSSWVDVVDAIDEWVSCVRDPVLGGCIASTGGGVMAVNEGFGPAEIVTGIAVGGGLVPCESRGAHHAIARHVPDRALAFGVPDHGPTDRYPDYEEDIGELMALLSPTVETSGTVFWMDDSIRINDGNPVTGIGLKAIHQNVKVLREAVASIDRSRPHVFNALIGSKYIYTKNGTSPTIWAYSHPDEPELPIDQTNTRREIEQSYENTLAALEFLVDEVFPANPGSRFVGPDELREIFSPADYQSVTDAELDVVARWTILSWGEAPPPYLSDGRSFYSLRDAIGLLARALAEDFPDRLELNLFHGPLEASPGAGECELDTTEVLEIARGIAAGLEPDADWQVTPRNILPSEVETSAGSLNAAQVLYALAMVYASTYAGAPVDVISVPDTLPVPETATVLGDYGCLECTDSAWSLKPARIAELP